MLVKLCSAFTAGAYALEAEELSRSAANCMMPLETYEYGPFASWHEAVAAKPSFILSRLRDLSSTYDGLLWVDADARIRRNPDWSILENADVAICKFKRRADADEEWLAGTSFWRRSTDVIAFVEAWASMTPRFLHTDTPEQFSMKAAWSTHSHALRLVDLPKSWCYIYDDFRILYPDIQPCVEHTQASRRLRHD